MHIHLSFRKCLLSTYYVLYTVKGTGYKAVNEAACFLLLESKQRLLFSKFSWGGRDITYCRRIYHGELWENGIRRNLTGGIAD